MKQTAEELCRGIHTLHDEAVALAESVLFMANKLRETQNAIANEPLVIKYDNGGGQAGIRENPHYVSYEHLLTAYGKSLRQLEDMIKNGSSSRNTSSVMKELSLIASRKTG